MAQGLNPCYSGCYARITELSVVTIDKGLNPCYSGCYARIILLISELIKTL